MTRVSKREERFSVSDILFTCQYHYAPAERGKMVNQAQLFIEKKSVMPAEAGSCEQEHKRTKDRPC
jgi:hypothetical protein